MQLLIASIKDGIVIDHIPSEQTLRIMNLLSLETYSESVIVAYNLHSSRMGKKGMIKIEKRDFTQEEINTIALLAVGATLNIIRNHKVTQKIPIELPDIIERIGKCPNTNCISNFETPSKFIKLADGSIQCYYCEKTYRADLLSKK